MVGLGLDKKVISGKVASYSGTKEKAKTRITEDLGGISLFLSQTSNYSSIDHTPSTQSNTIQIEETLT